MHDVTIPAEVRDRIVARRGHFEMFDKVDPARTALLIVDMQKAFVDEGAPIEVPAARGIIPNVNRLARAARGAGSKVIWIQMTVWEKDGANSWPLFYAHFATPEFGRKHLAALTDGSRLHALADKLDIEESDLRVTKSRFSAFIQGSSPIEGVLREHGIDTITIAGTLTNRCCESSARDAMMLGYKVILVEDANATTSNEEQLAALVNVATAFGDVRTTDAVIAMLTADG
jgi:ureidoacrylate peracid hydrolase